MTLSASRWHVIAESNFAWEREALEWLRTHLPDRDPWHVWTNFEFIDDEGKVNEVDALVLSPVFPAGGASADKPALGIQGFTAQVRRAALPVYALGGVDAKTADRLTGSGACGLAGVGAVQSAFAEAVVRT